MWICMSACVDAEPCPGLLLNISGLAVPRHGVVFGIGTYRRAARAIRPARTKGSGHAAAGCLDFKPPVTQQGDIPGAGTVLAPCRFTKIKNLLIPLGQGLSILRYPIDRMLLLGCYHLASRGFIDAACLKQDCAAFIMRIPYRAQWAINASKGSAIQVRRKKIATS